MGRSILHLADLHLGARHDYLGSAAAERAREADSVIDRIAQWVAMAGRGSREIGAVLIAGDLFDDPRPPDSLVIQTIRALRNIERAGIRLVTVPGNHDEWTYPDGVFRKNAREWPGTLVTATVPSRVAAIDLEGGVRVEIVSCAFQQGRNPRPCDWANPFEAAKAPGDRRIGLFHGTCDTMGLIAAGDRSFPLDLARLASWGLDYVALGHIHRRTVLPAGGCSAVYPGPIEGKGFDDPGSPEMTLIEMAAEGIGIRTLDARAAGIRAKDIEVYACDPVGISDAQHLEEEIARRAGPAKILQVAFSSPPRFPLDREDVVRRLGPDFHHLEFGGAEAEAPIGDWERLASERTLAGIFVQRVRRARDAAEGEGREDPEYWDQVAAAGLRALGVRGTR